jgi:hypothetical protein
MDDIEKQLNTLKLSLSKHINSTQTKETLSNINIHEKNTIFAGLNRGIYVSPPLSSKRPKIAKATSKCSHNLSKRHSSKRR